MNRRLGARPWLARTQEDYARMLLSSRGEPRRARRLLNDSLAAYAELGIGLLRRSGEGPCPIARHVRGHGPESSSNGLARATSTNAITMTPTTAGAG